MLKVSAGTTNAPTADGLWGGGNKKCKLLRSRQLNSNGGVLRVTYLQRARSVHARTRLCLTVDGRRAQKENQKKGANGTFRSAHRFTVS